MSEQRVTLQPGDYVSLNGMSDVTYRDIVTAFRRAGFERFTSGDMRDKWKFAVVSTTGGGILAGSQEGGCLRRLTVDQVLNATNAGGVVGHNPDTVMTDEHSTSGIEQALSDPGHPYHELADALEQAFQQASDGKGRERHANNLPFTEQRMQTIAHGQGHIGGMVYQICKKAQEAERLPRDAALRELLGAIVYASGAFIYLRDGGDDAKADR